MKNIKTVLVILVSSWTMPIWAQGMAEMMKQEMTQQLTDSCNDREFLSCIGMSQSACRSTTTKAIKKCDPLFPKSDADMADHNKFMAHGQCIEKNLQQISGISQNKIDRCEQLAGGAPPMPMPDADRGLEMMNKALQNHANATGTSAITLPLYKNATLMSHFTDGMQKQMFNDNRIQPLPAAMFASPDDMTTIASFYRQKLKGFKEYRVEKDIIFIENGPKKFDYAKDMKLYVTRPHVMIGPAFSAPGVPSNTRSRIEIAYRKK